MTPAKNKTKIKPTSKAKMQTDDTLNSIHVAKKAKVTCVENDCNIISVERPVASRHEWTDYRYHPVNEDWQRRACELLGIRFIRPFQRQDGGPDTILTRPDLRSMKSVGGDGNCLFRALCYIISGSEHQHLQVRAAIVAHMRSIADLVSGFGPDGNRNYLVTYDHGYSSVEEYFARSHMAEHSRWGRDFEMCILAHLLDTPVYSFQGDSGHNYWLCCLSHGIDRRIPVNVNVPSMYIYLQRNHFWVVTAVRQRLTS